MSPGDPLRFGFKLRPKNTEPNSKWIGIYGPPKGVCHLPFWKNANVVDTFRPISFAHNYIFEKDVNVKVDLLGKLHLFSSYMCNWIIGAKQWNRVMTVSVRYTTQPYHYGYNWGHACSSMFKDLQAGLILNEGSGGNCLHCPWSLPWCPLKCSNRNLQIPHRGALYQGKIALPLQVRSIRSVQGIAGQILHLNLLG